MGQSSNLGQWIRRLRQPSSEGAAPVIDPAAPEARDSAIHFAAEHTRRYIASNGEDDGWDGPRPILILYTTGRRSGETRRNPVLYFEQDGRRYVIASKGGDDEQPAWYLNLVADPHVQVRVMADVYAATARPLPVDERAGLWAVLVERYPMFAEYQATTERLIPVVELVPDA